MIKSIICSLCLISFLPACLFDTFAEPQFSIDIKTETFTLPLKKWDGSIPSGCPKEGVSVIGRHDSDNSSLSAYVAVIACVSNLSMINGIPIDVEKYTSPDNRTLFYFYTESNKCIYYRNGEIKGNVTFFGIENPSRLPSTFEVKLDVSFPATLDCDGDKKNLTVNIEGRDHVTVLTCT